MDSFYDRIRASGIEITSTRLGDHRATCPKCSFTRVKKTDPCLSITIDSKGLVANCWHCNWTHFVPNNDNITNFSEKKTVYKRPQKPVDPSTERVYKFFEARGISRKTVDENGIGSAKIYFRALDPVVPPGETYPLREAIAYPFFRDGEVINYKFRALDEKTFAQTQGCERIFFGLDNIRPGVKGDAEKDDRTILITEGEADVLALYEAGYKRAISIPDGAPSKPVENLSAKKFHYLSADEDLLAAADRYILAVDNDEKGEILFNELARRLGKDKCWRVTWPSLGDAKCKDANDVLMMYGPEVLRECIEAAEPLPIDGLFYAKNYLNSVVDFYHKGYEAGLSTGFASMDELFKVRRGELTVITGIPGSGKSAWIDNVMINMSRQHNWKFAVCSFENEPKIHIKDLAEKFCKKPFWGHFAGRMSEDDLKQAIEWLSEHIWFISLNDDSPTISRILQIAESAVLRYGVDGLVIDPYNYLEHEKRYQSDSETTYVAHIMARLKKFCATRNVHTFFVAHPAKMRRENGKTPIPTLYDISGSAHFFNATDNGIVVHRERGEGGTGISDKTEVYVQKIRFRFNGKIGSTSFDYDQLTGSYSDSGEYYKYTYPENVVPS